MSQPTPGPAPTSNPLTCVIWHAGATELPGELLTSLSRRIGRMRVCTNAYAAFAEICSLQRAFRLNGPATTASTLRGPNGVVLVLVQPTQLAEIPGVIDAIELYAPGTALWCYDRGANPKLRGVVSGDVQTWRDQSSESFDEIAQSPTRGREVAPSYISMPVIHTRPIPEIAPRPVAPPSGTPQMRLVGIEEPIEPPTHRVPGGIGGPLSEEELRMLLSDDPPAPPLPRGGGDRR